MGEDERGETAPVQMERKGPEEEGAEPGAKKKKKKVLHARIPESLDREIKKRAGNLGMSVSTVVRNVLLHTFDLVEDIVTDSTNIALSIAGEESPSSDHKTRPRWSPAHDGAPDTGVLGWQEAILNRNAVCDRCNAILPRGSAAAIGIRETPGPRSIICGTCLAALAPGREDGPARPAAGKHTGRRLRRPGSKGR